MIKIGQTNHLTAVEKTEYGMYLVDAANPGERILLPNRYCTDKLSVGDSLDVFVYTDSEDRPVATTEVPLCSVGQFAYLQAVDNTRVGTFLDWGLPKNLLVPFNEQKIKMRPSGVYLVYVYLDDASKRVVASAKIEKFLGNVIPRYRRGQRVSCLVIEHTPIGYRVIVDNLHRGMIYHTELHHPLELEQTTTAWVKAVRPDGKIDLTTTTPGAAGRADKLAHSILKQIQNGDFMLTEKSSPDQISDALQCSKRDFKRAIGALYKQRLITINADGTYTPART